MDDSSIDSEHKESFVRSLKTERRRELWAFTRGRREVVSVQPLSGRGTVPNRNGTVVNAVPRSTGVGFTIIDDAMHCTIRAFTTVRTTASMISVSLLWFMTIMLLALMAETATS